MSRTPATEAAYLRRALWFEEHVQRALKVDNPDPREVASFAVEAKTTWGKATWRQIKAALIFRYTAMGTEAALAAVRTLAMERQTGCVVKPHRTSATRKKSVSDADIAGVVQALRETRSTYAAPLEKWIVLGSLTGLRPHEWAQAEVILLRRALAEGRPIPLEIDPPIPFLRVRNAKDTNARSHGELRHIDLSPLPSDTVEEIAAFCQFMKEIVSSGGYTKFYSGCQKLLYRVGSAFTTYAGHRLQIYSARHRFSSDAKKSLSREAVAALMGHATNQTAVRHYGRRPAGGASGIAIRPLATEVAKVKIVTSGFPGVDTQTQNPAPAPKGPRVPSMQPDQGSS